MQVYVRAEIEPEHAADERVLAEVGWSYLTGGTLRPDMPTITLPLEPSPWSARRALAQWPMSQSRSPGDPCLMEPNRQLPGTCRGMGPDLLACRSFWTEPIAEGVSSLLPSARQTGKRNLAKAERAEACLIPMRVPPRFLCSPSGMGSLMWSTPGLP
ncbi:MAG: hypothetical protein R2693_07400 [Nocardioidaceae bacterium]